MLLPNGQSVRLGWPYAVKIFFHGFGITRSSAKSIFCISHNVTDNFWCLTHEYLIPVNSVFYIMQFVNCLKFLFYFLAIFLRYLNLLSSLFYFFTYTEKRKSLIFFPSFTLTNSQHKLHLQLQLHKHFNISQVTLNKLTLLAIVNVEI